MSRLARFYAVGALGFAVQLGTLALLAGPLGVGALAATVLAVEAAVLHNFVWHERWTWADRVGRRRPGLSGRRAVLGRLARFHLANGLVSVGGNLGLTALLAGAAGWPLLAANATAVAVCSLLNFLAGDRLVYAATVLALVAWTGGRAEAATLTPGTAAAWDAYAGRVEARRAAEAADPRRFLAAEFLGDAFWRDCRARALAGAICLRPLGDGGKGSLAVEGGLVHHWLGVAFIPGTTLAQVLDWVRDYDRSAEWFDDVEASRRISGQGDAFRIFLRLKRSKVITVRYDSEHDVRFTWRDPSHVSCHSVATRLSEIGDAGSARERAKPAGQDRGFLWRLVADWRYAEVDGGVLVELESLSLSRSVPALARVLVGPYLDSVPRESVERTLGAIRRGVPAASTAAGRPRSSR